MNITELCTLAIATAVMAPMTGAVPAVAAGVQPHGTHSINQTGSTLTYTSYVNSNSFGHVRAVVGRTKYVGSL